MKYLFILGRNPELSIAELRAVLGNFEYAQNKNAILVELDEVLEAGFVDRLGGTIAIGQVMATDSNIQGVLKTLEKQEIYFGEENKFNYVVWDFSESAEEIENYLKRRFKSEKLKTTHKKISEFMEMQDGKRVMVLDSSRLIDQEYFVFEANDEICFGKIIQRTDSKEIEKRDMEKPVRRESLSISPRLAKIMINLSGAREGDRLLDCFCGVGVVLAEALNLGLKVVGVDKDSEAIAGAKENLKHFGFDSESYKVINYDSARVEISGQLNVLVCEPDFGETLKKMASDLQAKKTIENFENLMIDVLRNFSSKVSGRIVFSAPLIKTNRGRAGADLEKIASAVNRKIVEGFPIEEFRKNQFVGRQIVVLA